jgi:hypothetical protein
MSRRLDEVGKRAAWTAASAAGGAVITGADTRAGGLDEGGKKDPHHHLSGAECCTPSPGWPVKTTAESARFRQNF